MSVERRTQTENPSIQEVIVACPGVKETSWEKETSGTGVAHMPNLTSCV